MRRSETPLANPSSCARYIVRPNKTKCWSLEQREAYCRAEQGKQGSSCSKDLNSHMLFWKRVFIGKICWGRGGLQSV